MGILDRVLRAGEGKKIKALAALVPDINALESAMKQLSDEALRAKTAEFQSRHERGESLDDLLIEAFAALREAALRVIGQRHFDVQLMGGAALHFGWVAEMKTGEGKTLTSSLAAYLNGVGGKGTHIITVNDYLARRDSEWMGRVHRFLGLTVGCILNGLTDAQRQDAYRCDVTYGQNNEFGFDYLRDNMKFRLQDYVQRELNFAIVDEVDSILIDEARTPLIISGPTDITTDAYVRVDRAIPGLLPDQDYTLDEKGRSVALTDAGIEKLQKRLGVENLYAPEQVENLHHVEQALRAHTLYKRDREYVVQGGEVVIVDEFTGRLMPGRRWSDGLHQAIEAKEGVKIENENQTLATISFQNYFRMYTKLSGMTGTADTEAEEFSKIYNLEVRVIPTNRPMVRKDLDDVVYRTEREKFEAAAAEIETLNKRGQPVLVGTVSIAKSEALSQVLKKRGVPHNVLNAKQHAREADIVAQAGRKGSVTIATNMAGRGTDILLGGNAEALARAEVGPEPLPPEEPQVEGQPIDLHPYEQGLADWKARYASALERAKETTAKERAEVQELGGLFILGTERHESRRIDNQLRGRAGRQGDPGVSKFYLSLEDDLMRIFGAERIQGLMQTLGMQEGEVIEHSLLSRAIENAQRRVEGHNFDIRKNLLEYDDVMNQQRRTIYKLRRQVLAAGAGIPLVEWDEEPRTKKKVRTEKMVTWPDFRELVLDAVEDSIISLTDTQLGAANPTSWDVAGFEKAVKSAFNVDMGFGQAGSREEIQEQIFQVVDRIYREREGDYGDDFHRFCQVRYLSTIDQLWKDHLLGMDHLRQGIGLRGYGQKDPKQEYKREGFAGFVRMLAAIKGQFVAQVMRLQPKAAAEEATRLARQLAEQHRRTQLGRGDGGEGGGMVKVKVEVPQQQVNAPPPGMRPAPQAPSTREGPRVGRNDPCPCGSGKKYKKCHGAADAE
jgi:preprotein translocase subunit SecA